uniref:Uncharacterized protein n=1 Tax=Leersia perrieri TaxID=77586 RepID=A0A0D9VPM5_9ORYZ
MEKGAEVMMQKAPEKEATAAAAMGCYRRTVGADATFTERSKDLLRQFKDAPVGDHWVCLKNKVRAAGEYASIRTLFGDTKDGDSSKKPSSAEN